MLFEIFIDAMAIKPFFLLIISEQLYAYSHRYLLLVVKFEDGFGWPCRHFNSSQDPKNINITSSQKKQTPAVGVNIFALSING